MASSTWLESPARCEFSPANFAYLRLTAGTGTAAYNYGR
jgi:hypothetical protein